MSNTGMVWEEPPLVEHGGARRAGIWGPILGDLMSRPGVWARVRNTAKGSAAATIASNLRRRFVANLPPGRFEYTSRQFPDGTGAVYARYLGPEEAKRDG